MDYENDYIPEEPQQETLSENQPEPQVEYQPEPQVEYEPEYQSAYIPPYQPEPPKKKKRSHTGKIVALALVCSLVGGVTGAGFVSLYQDLQAPQQLPSAGSIQVGQRENTVLDITQIDTNKLMTPAEVYAANVNSTVGITTTTVTTNFWGYQTPSASSGSGFILTESGYILTNYHVIEKSSTISVSLYDGRSFEAELINYDQTNDIAVLKIEADDLSPVVLGDSSNMNVGDSVVAIGNPLGELTFSLTSGSVSALNRDVTMSNGVNMNLIQTDCAINSGNSGGALFNLYGEVIGITNAKYSSGSGEASIDNIGFAIPLNDVLSMVESIIEKGYVSKPYIGISVVDVSTEMQAFGLPKGAALQNVAVDSPAGKAGLQPNDIITKIDDTEITSSTDVVQFVKTTSVGQELKVTVYRQGQTLVLTVVVEEQAQTQVQNSQSTQQSSQSSQYYPDSIYPFIP